MTFLPALLVAIATGVQRALAATQYIPDGDTLIISTSVQPCSLIGDPDLYGLGVRVAFYISFGTSLIAIVFGLYDELKVPRLSFNVLFASLLIILARNVHQGSFAIFEWYIVTGLSFISISSAFVPLPAADDEQEEDASGGGEKTPDGDDGDIVYPTPDTHMTGARDPGLEAPVDNTAGDSEGHQTRDVEANPGGSAEDDETKFVNEFAFEKYRIFLSGPVSLGFSYFLYGVSALMQPWLYFTQMNSGHREGCPVPFVFLGTFDMYNENWQRWLKAVAAMGIFSSVLLLLPSAAFFIIFGAATRKHRAAALLELDKKLDKRIKEANRARKELEQHQKEQREQEKQRKRPTDPDNADAPRGPEQQLEHEINKLKKEVDRDEAKRWKWWIMRDKVKEARESNEKKRVSAWIRRIPVVIIVGVFFGALPIYFIERTLQLNQVDLGTSLSDSSGQMLALLVAVFTSLGFVWQVLDNYLEGKKRRDELKSVLESLDSGIDGFIYAVDSRIANNQKKLRQMVSVKTLIERFPRSRGRSGHADATEPLAAAEPATSRRWFTYRTTR